MPMVVAPASRRAAIDRTAQLRGACRQRYGSIVLNLDGLIAPGDAAVLREDRGDPLRLAHQVFIDYLAQSLTEHPTPVIHEPFIGGVVAPKVFEVVGEG